jgi:DNA-binding HxlR family transcriptional regulator
MQLVNQLLLAGLCLLNTTAYVSAGIKTVPTDLHLAKLMVVADTTNPGQPDPQSPPNQPVGGGLADDITGEIENIIGESENAIMQGIQDELNDLLGNALGQLFDVSPISAVKSLQSMVKDGLSKQQKIEYQNYKVDYAWKKAHTELSPAFATYYKDLNLNQLTNAIQASKKAAEKFLNTPAFTNTEVGAMQQSLTSIADTGDLEAEVKTIINLGNKPVWMSEGERLSALNTVRTDLYDRIKRLNQLQNLIRASYQFRSREIAKNAYRQGLYNKNTNLNRTVGTRGTTYQTR